MVIQLDNNPGNLRMLNLIYKELGGKVTIVGHRIIWSINDTKNIISFCNTFKDYPLLTKRKRYQLAFLNAIYSIYKNTSKEEAMKLYFELRNSKYDSKTYSVLSNKTGCNNYYIPIKYHELDTEYFSNWFAGFIEAKGSFSLSASKDHSISFSNEDYELMEYCKTFFEIPNKIRNKGNEGFLIECYSNKMLDKFTIFFTKYPLYGNRFDEFILFKNNRVRKDLL